MNKTAIFVANRGFALFNSRLKLMLRLKNEYAYNVIAICERDTYAVELEKNGFTVIPLDVHRGGGSLTKDLYLFLFLCKTYKKIKPGFIHHFHSKPVIFGTLASRFFSPKTKVINTITGLGYAFTQGGMIQKITSILYKISLPFSQHVIFQNSDDLEYFLSSGFIKKEKTTLINGSGVDLEKYQPNHNKHHTETFTILMAGRLLWQKGIKEYIEAATAITQKHSNVRFLLGGEIELTHPDAVPESVITSAKAIQFLGYISDMPKLLAEDIDLFVLPSFYREGVPRVLLEAAACGIPVICADAPGTREAVIHNKTGFIVPIKNSQSICNAIEELLADKNRYVEMSKSARLFAESHFDINVITQKQLDIYQSIGVEL